MIWWQWVVVGVLLLGSELVVVDAGFYLVFLGVAALCMGGLGLVPVPLSISTQWILFATLALVGTVFFRQRFYERIRGEMPQLGEGVTGEVAVATETIEPGRVGRVELRGSEWTAENVGDRAIPAGARTRVERLDGLTVSVRILE